MNRYRAYIIAAIIALLALAAGWFRHQAHETAADLDRQHAHKQRYCHDLAFEWERGVTLEATTASTRAKAVEAGLASAATLAEIQARFASVSESIRYCLFSDTHPVPVSEASREETAHALFERLRYATTYQEQLEAIHAFEAALKEF